jgi:hypothetical protein
MDISDTKGNYLDTTKSKSIDNLSFDMISAEDFVGKMFSDET